MKIGFVGLGIMGESMCENIIKKHDDKVYIYDLDREKIELLANKGAIACTSSAEVAERADVFITMVPKSQHSQAVYQEILQVLNESKICIDMSTIDPGVSVEISELVKKTGASFIDAPVVKSKPAAISGDLGIYVGGDEKIFDKVKPILLYMGKNIIYMGQNGKGLVMKICHNALVSQIQNGVNETLTLAQANGISISDFYTAVTYGGAANWYLDGQYKKLEAQDWTTAFSIENMNKDVDICIRLASEKGIKMPGEENVQNIYKKAMINHLGKDDFRATYRIVRGDFE